MSCCLLITYVGNGNSLAHTSKHAASPVLCSCRRPPTTKRSLPSIKHSLGVLRRVRTTGSRDHARQVLVGRHLTNHMSTTPFIVVLFTCFCLSLRRTNTKMFMSGASFYSHYVIPRRIH